ncbi:MAG: hypothetical protein ACLTDF_06205 [Coprococcus sp.]
MDKSLGKDEQVLDTVGIEGLTVQSYRRVYDGDGNVISDNPEATSVYSKRDEVYKVGKLPRTRIKTKIRIRTKIRVTAQTQIRRRLSLSQILRKSSCRLLLNVV